jgi:hypothetical protein
MSRWLISYAEHTADWGLIRHRSAIIDQHPADWFAIHNGNQVIIFALECPPPAPVRIDRHKKLTVARSRLVQERA